ncbi:phospho-sugar mutase [Humibacter ginsenosidimutans]|uniref:Phospho-sugar mutase n=1 Tax=Humibacter ginsenosidimutans TaxID=2599293 RepID=A0A5B8M9J8_9MICO|nr:phospho-sugar mutase [Humibacter ginsenosidimutans]
MSDAEVVAAARAWIPDDPDAETRAELQAIVDEAVAGSGEAVADLHSRFDTRLAFGTAGLRGEIAAGPNRMNRVLVAQAAAGLAAYLVEQAAESGVTPSVVIGYDGRTNSQVFARDTAEVMAGAGVRAVLLPRLLPTPVLAFAVRHLKASAGVMVTASHNPARDNGYKVYLGGADEGSQIVPPADGLIAAHIDEVARGAVSDLPRSDDYEIAEESLVDAYVAATAAVAGHGTTRTAGADHGSGLRVVYTAMHGVGWQTASAVFAAAGLSVPVSVPEQQEPDPDFPTVSFPNPEEPGALDLAFALAREAGAQLVIANDPDADRLAIGIPDESSAEGFRRLSGNEVGMLLGWTAAELAAESGLDGALAASIVSSPALKAVADAHGLRFAETLTGFKWVSRVPGLLFGYEEALGYLVNPQTVRDKDGISAATFALALAQRLHAEGRTIADRLDEFTERFGAYASDQISIRVTDLDRISRIMAALRAEPPAHVGDAVVVRIDDLREGSATLPPSDVLRIVLDDGSRVMVRPSGTEPKLKIYIDAFDDGDTDAAARRAAAQSRADAVGAAMRVLTDAV